MKGMVFMVLRRQFRTKVLVLPIIMLSLQGCEPEEFFNTLTIEDYKAARAVFWQELYPGDSQTLYCGSDANSNSRNGVNIEHVFPMSWVTNGLNCGTRKQCRQRSAIFNQIEADLHNLYPSKTEVNAARASFRFGEVRGERRDFGNGCDFEVDHRKRVAEPREAVRGDIARAMFYMAWRYKDQGLTIFRSSGELLKKWHNSDPPSEEEVGRNNKIERLQGNRNPFIDEPEKLNELVSQGYFY